MQNTCHPPPRLLRALNPRRRAIAVNPPAGRNAPFQTLFKHFSHSTSVPINCASPQQKRKEKTNVQNLLWRYKRLAGVVQQQRTTAGGLRDEVKRENLPFPGSAPPPRFLLLAGLCQSSSLKAAASPSHRTPKVHFPKNLENHDLISLKTPRVALEQTTTRTTQ